MKNERLHCKGGPGGDFWHEVQPGWPIPDRLMIECLNGEFCWFDVIEGVAYYSNNQN